MKTVTATEANQHFSRVLERVEKGETVTITKRGEAVATLMPAKRVNSEERAEAHRRFIQRLLTQPPLNVPRGTRDELYDD